MKEKGIETVYSYIVKNEKRKTQNYKSNREEWEMDKVAEVLSDYVKRN